MNYYYYIIMFMFLNEPGRVALLSSLCKLLWTVVLFFHLFRSQIYNLLRSTVYCCAQFYFFSRLSRPTVRKACHQPKHSFRVYLQHCRCSANALPRRWNHKLSWWKTSGLTVSVLLSYTGHSIRQTCEGSTFLISSRASVQPDLQRNL